MHTFTLISRVIKSFKPPPLKDSGERACAHSAIMWSADAVQPDGTELCGNFMGGSPFKTAASPLVSCVEPSQSFTKFHL